MTSHTRGSHRTAICLHKALCHDTRGPGGLAAAAVAARAGGRIRTGRSSSRPGGRCSVCQSAPSACAARARSGAGKRGGAGKRAAAAAAAARAGGLIRTGRSDRLGGRRRSRRKLSMYVQKPSAAFVAQFAPVKRMAVLAPAEGLHAAHHAVRARYSDFAICSCGGVSQICQWYRVCDAGALRAEPLATLYVLRGHNFCPYPSSTQSQRSMSC